MITETERLILRRYKETDLQDLYEYLSDSKVVEFEPYKPMTMEEVKGNLEWRISTDEMIAVELKETGKMIGNVYLGKRDFESLEIGYVFIRRYTPFQISFYLFHGHCLIWFMLHNLWIGQVFIQILQIFFLISS